MIRTLALIKRRADLDRAGFRAHYERVHTPLALPHLAGLERYVRYHVEEDLHGEVGFDVLTAFWYRDAVAVERILALLESEEGAPIREDELRFMDKSANRFFPVSERRLLAGEEGDEHLFIVLSRPPGMTRFEGSKIVVRDHWPSLAKALVAPAFALLRDAFPMSGREPPCDAVLQVRAGAGHGLSGWAKALEAEGYGVAAVRTRRFETPLGGLGVRDPRNDAPSR
jgi:hypothetical protein